MMPNIVSAACEDIVFTISPCVELKLKLDIFQSQLRFSAIAITNSNFPEFSQELIVMNIVCLLSLLDFDDVY